MSNKYTRRDFLTGMGAAGVGLALSSQIFAESKRPNVLFITADDMDYGSLRVTGCKAPNISPSIDGIAAQGMRFEQAHVTAAICQPSRSVLMTGRYPHRNGAMGFEPINVDTPTLEESLRAAGYMNGIMAKVGHLAPQPKFCWDIIVDAKVLRSGKDPQMFYKYSKDFFEQAKSESKPFFLMANSQDPHRPFPGSAGEGGKNKDFPEVSRTYKADEITVPPFLPDGIPDIRREIAQYFTAVHRCDEAVGQVLKALKESGMEENTLVIFISDNGISVPYAKTNCYLASTRTPLIVRWPGRIKPGNINRHDLVSGIDFMPTILDAIGLKGRTPGVDGRSFVPLLEGQTQDGRDKVFTFINETSAKNEYPMRCVRTEKFSYIYNAWADGKTVFKNEPRAGLTFKAMQAASQKDKAIAERVKFFLYRTREEFYDLQADPYELNTLAADAKYKPEIEKMRGEMLQMMTSTKDPILPKFREQIGK